MSRKYKYTILIRFSSSDNDVLGTFQAEYPFSNNSALKDDFSIKGKSIKITAFRSKKTEISDVLHNANNAMNRQLSKALAYYYCRIGEANLISSIKITRHLSGNLQDEVNISKNDVRQVVASSSDLELLTSIQQNELNNILHESDSGHALLFAITHLIRSCASTEPFERFEALWRSFNSLYKLKESETRDSTCLMNLRKHMLANANEYPLSCALTNPMTHDQIFSRVNWRNMILNDYATASKTVALSGFIGRISDPRLIQKIEDSLPIRQSFLSAQGLLTEVEAHIRDKKSLNIKSDIEIVAFICLKYLYYARNKLVHAERVHPSFHIIKARSNEEIKIGWCCEVLLRLILDLFNGNSRF